MPCAQILITWSDDKALTPDDAAMGGSQSPSDCFIVPTFCELLPDIYRLFTLYCDSSDAVAESVHPDVDPPRALGLGALLRLLRDASVLDNEVRRKYPFDRPQNYKTNMSWINCRYHWLQWTQSWHPSSESRPATFLSRLLPVFRSVTSVPH
jgi:hypothetical protein